MFLMDVNVLVYAHREDTPEHSVYREWLESTVNDTVPYSLMGSWFCCLLSNFVHILMSINY